MGAALSEVLSVWDLEPEVFFALSLCSLWPLPSRACVKYPVMDDWCKTRLGLFVLVEMVGMVLVKSQEVVLCGVDEGDWQTLVAQLKADDVNVLGA